jgi:EpsI family protein
MRPVRAATVVVILACMGALTHAARRGRPPAVDFTRLPYAVQTWTGTDAPPLDAETVRVLAADAYVNRTYSDGAGAPVGVYVAFYSEQRPGVSIHSPLHCLPGTGWEPLDVRTVDLREGGRSIAAMRRLVIRKNRERALVLYAYAVHNRLIASEIGSKLWLLHDSIRLGRSDASLIRIVVPVGPSVDAAERRGLAFTRDLLPYVSRLWS